MREKGWGLWRKQWYSICSRHRAYSDGCDLCNAGEWVSVVGHVIESAIHDHAYPVWFWWANRPSAKRAFAKKMRGWGFPNFPG